MTPEDERVALDFPEPNDPWVKPDPEWVPWFASKVFWISLTMIILDVAAFVTLAMAVAG